MKDIYLITASFVGEITRDFDNYMRMTKKAGYKGGFTVYYDYVRAGDDPYKLSRIPIYGNLRLPMLRFWIRLKAAPVVGRLERLRASLLESNHDILAEFIPTP